MGVELTRRLCHLLAMQIRNSALAYGNEKIMVPAVDAFDSEQSAVHHKMLEYIEIMKFKLAVE
jgi:hypothetical protein